MNDLYRIHVGEEWLYEGGPEDVLQSLKDDGVLVPATVDDLDVEAVAREIVDQEWTDIYDILEDYKQERAKRLARLYLEAALGGTNES